jgi:hypothetical protein
LYGYEGPFVDDRDAEVLNQPRSHPGLCRPIGIWYQQPTEKLDY